MLSDMGEPPACRYWLLLLLLLGLWLLLLLSLALTGFLAVTVTVSLAVTGSLAVAVTVSLAVAAAGCRRCLQHAAGFTKPRHFSRDFSCTSVQNVFFFLQCHTCG